MAADERPAQILAAACRAIIRRGFTATRIADIAREAGTSTGTVHYYFDTKDDVLLAALKWANEQPYRRLDEVLGGDADATTKLAKLLQLSVPYPGMLHDEFALWIEFWTRVLHRRDLLPESEEISARWRGYFFDIVRDGTVDGEFRPVAPPDEVAERLLALVDGFGFEAVLGHGWMPPERMRDLLLRFAAEQLRVPYEELDARALASDIPGDLTGHGG